MSKFFANFFAKFIEIALDIKKMFFAFLSFCKNPLQNFPPRVTMVTIKEKRGTTP